MGGGRLATALLGLLTIRAVTTFLTPEQYGQLAMLLVVQTFCGLLLVNPVGMHINRHTHEWWDDGSLMSRLRTYKYYILAVSLIGGLAAVAVSAHLSMMQIAVIVMVMILMVNSGTWNATWIPLLNMVGQRGAAVGWSLVTGVVGLLVSVLLCAVWPIATAWFAGQAIGMAFGAIGAGRVLRERTLEKKNTASLPLLDRKTIITYCLPLALGTGFMWLQLSGYRLLVEHYWGLSLLGFLAVGLLLAGQIWSLTESLAQQFLNPLFYRRIAQSDSNASSAALSDLMNVLVPVYFVLAGMTFLGAPYLIRLLTAPQYADAEIFMRLGVGIEFCRVVANLLSNAAHVTKNTRAIIFPYALGAVVLFAMLAFAAIHGLGVSWVAVSLLCAAVLMLGVMWSAMLSEVRFFLDMRRWLFALLTMVLFAISAHWLERPTNWVDAVLALSVIGLLGGAAVVVLLKGNPALQRLLIVDLKSGNKAT